MRATGLPARILYAVAATPLAAFGGFSFGILLFTKILPSLHRELSSEPGWAEFAFSLMLGVAVAFPVLCWTLTLPRLRLRRRAGRAWRIAVSSLLVLMVSVFVHAEGVPLRYTFAGMVWMALILMFTFVRYGLVGGERRRSRRKVYGLH